MSRERSLLFALMMVTALAVSGAAPQPVRAAEEAKVCGIVAVHVRATGLLPGILTVGSSSFVIAQGTTLGSAVSVGANVCLDLTFNSTAEIAAAAVTPNVSSMLVICGTVTRYVAATAIAAGSLTIDGGTSVVAIGATLPPSVSAGANLCMRLTLNGHGQIASAVVQANVTSTLDVCGVVNAYVAGSATTNGSLAIAGRAFVVAVRALMPGSVTVGANLCIRLTLNGFGQVSGGTTQANLASVLEVCGQVNAFTPATSAANGGMAIGGTTHLIVAGSALSPAITVNAYLRLRLTLDVLMRITDAKVLKVGVSVADACSSTTVLIPTPSADGEPAPDPDQGGSTLPGASGSAAPGSPNDATHSRPNGLRRPGVRPGVQPDVSAETRAGLKNACGCSRAPAPGGSHVDAGQFLPDAASMSRAAMALLQVSLPLMLLLFGLLGRELVLRGRALTAARHPEVRVPKA